MTINLPPIARKERKETPLHGTVPHRRLRMAARERQPRGDRLPGGGKRLRRGADKAARRPARRPLPGDALAHKADRRLGSLPRWRLVVLTRTEEGKQYAIHCRKPADGNQLLTNCHPERAQRVEGPAGAPGLDSEAGDTSTPKPPRQNRSSSTATNWPRATPFSPSAQRTSRDDGRWLAYTTDTTGFRQYTLHIKDLETGETLAG